MRPGSIRRGLCGAALLTIVAAGASTPSAALMAFGTAAADLIIDTVAAPSNVSPGPIFNATDVIRNGRHGRQPIVGHALLLLSRRGQEQRRRSLDWQPLDSNATAGSESHGVAKSRPLPLWHRELTRCSRAPMTHGSSQKTMRRITARPPRRWSRRRSPTWSKAPCQTRRQQPLRAHRFRSPIPFTIPVLSPWRHPYLGSISRATRFEILGCVVERHTQRCRPGIRRFIDW